MPVDLLNLYSSIIKSDVNKKLQSVKNGLEFFYAIIKIQNEKIKEIVAV